MTTPAEHCDEIIQLIDDALAMAAQAPAGQARPRRPSGDRRDPAEPSSGTSFAF